jgi:hypothetical protein
MEVDSGQLCHLEPGSRFVLVMLPSSVASR